MAKTESTMLPLGTPAPGFSLTDTVTGRMVALQDTSGAPALLVMFLCNHCPYVIHVRDVLAVLTADLSARGVAVVGISANDPEKYPQDGPEKMKIEAEAHGYRFPYLFDATQRVALAYRAACTPDFFLFDGAQRLAYRGQLDDSRPGNGKPVTGRDLLAAVNAVLEGQTVATDQRPSMGCNIKWRPENSPTF